MASEVEKLGLNIQMPSHIEEKRMPRHKKINLADVENWIKSKHYSQDIEEKLIKKLRVMPDGTYHLFAKNVRGYINGFQKEKTAQNGNNNNPADTKK